MHTYIVQFIELIIINEAVNDDENQPSKGGGVAGAENINILIWTLIKTVITFAGCRKPASEPGVASEPASPGRGLRGNPGTRKPVKTLEF